MATEPIAGTSLATLLNNAIDDRVTDQRSRTDVIAAMGRAAGISASTVNQILNESITCPPLDRLRGFATVLTPSLSSMRSAAEQDGCTYDSEGLATNCNIPGLMSWLKIVNKAEREVEITIEGIIGGPFFAEGVTMEQVNRDLKNLKAVDADKIIINIINSPGGSVKHGLGIIDILEGFEAEKHVKILGMAASMAAELAMVAKKENREMTKNSHILFHRLSGDPKGTIKEIESDIAFMKDNEAKLIDIVVEGTDLDKSGVEALMDRNGGKGEFINAEDAEEMGLIGKVTGKEPVTMAAFTEEIPGLPTLPQNLVKHPEPQTVDTQGIVDKIWEKMKALLPTGDNAPDESAVKALIKTEVDGVKAEYDPQLAELNETKIESGIAKADVKRLTKEIQDLADGTDNGGDRDPSLKGKDEFNMGAEILAKMSPSMRSQLNKKAKAIADAEAKLAAAKKS